MLRLRPALESSDVSYACVLKSYASDVPGQKYFTFPDATRWDRLRLVWMVLRVAFILFRVRPDVVISTGAAPGYVAVRLGKFLGARTIWLDSIANVEKLSLSGEKIGRHADLWLSQWEHLSKVDGPEYKGSVI